MVVEVLTDLDLLDFGSVLIQDSDEFISENEKSDVVSSLSRWGFCLILMGSFTYSTIS